MDITAAGLWATMGPFAKGVVGVLVLMSVVSLGVVVERLAHFARSQRRSRAFVKELGALAASGELAAAAQLGAGMAKRAEGGFLGRVLGAGLAAYQSASGRAPDVVIESTLRAVERSSGRELATLRRGLGLLATVGTTAPFVGLLGTVMGIINTFQLMKGGSASLTTVGPGISEALVTTAMGLVVAIPAVVGFNYLSGRVDGFTVDMQESASELVDWVAKGVDRRVA